MKRKLIYAASFIILTLSFTQCQKNCKVCQQNDYDQNSGALLREGSEKEYCDVELIGIEASKPVTLLGVTTKWVCR